MSVFRFFEFCDEPLVRRGGVVEERGGCGPRDSSRKAVEQERGSFSDRPTFGNCMQQIPRIFPRDGTRFKEGKVGERQGRRRRGCSKQCSNPPTRGRSHYRKGQECPWHSTHPRDASFRHHPLRSLSFPSLVVYQSAPSISPGVCFLNPPLPQTGCYRALNRTPRRIGQNR